MPTLDFKGKQFVYAHHLSVPFRELKIDAKKSLPAAGAKPDLDDNLIIHGDNLHALKALLPQYAGKIKCIYIDPPYNTGKEGWSYNDNVNGALIKNWLQLAQPVDREDMERHDKWLCMMWPRLQLLKELLASEGVIFISIDDNEMHNLRALMDEIFGEDNFLGQITVMVNPKGRGLKGSDFAKTHEYIVAYQGTQREDALGKEKSDEKVEKEYREIDEDGSRFRALELRNTHREFGKHNRENLYYPFYVNAKMDIKLEAASGYKAVYPIWDDGYEGCWTWDAIKSERDLHLLIAREVKGKVKIYRKSFPETEEGDRVKQKIKTIWTSPKFFTEQGKKDLNEIVPKNSFETPKPLELVREVISLFSPENLIVLDSFAGSGTTGQAVLTLNAQDGEQRKFILIECEDYADNTTAERARKVIKGVPNAEDQLSRQGCKDGFTYCELGQEINIDSLLKGDDLPDYEALARYVFYTATGKTLEKVSKPTADWLIGETGMYNVHLIYKPDVEFLRGNDSALNADLVTKIQARGKGKKSLVFATAKFMGQKELSAANIDFCQLPYAIHRILGE